MNAPHPSRDELLAMAFVDNQLDDSARVAFQARLTEEPELAREVAALARIELIAQSSAPPEPIDLAWQNIDTSPSQRAALGFGWLLLFAGVLGLVAIALISLFTGLLPFWQKACFGALLVGISLIFLAILRRRILSRPFDPYSAVKR